MTRQDYEERRRRLDDELRAGQELLDASHWAQVRALDLLWTAQTGEAALPDKKARRPAMELHDAVFSSLDQLPEVFTKDDVCRILGETPDRRALYRVLHNLVFDGWLKIEEVGTARIPSSYRRLVSPGSAQGTPRS
ncbi:MAG TPA: hypothetical protein VN493_06300 [Thermoanaerobaculia bacterium]|nr:hypothetical protein [Thermoanaerobaculia bacterium]